MNAIGNKIRMVRELRGYSQEYMADRMGISQTSYSRLESEATDLTLSRLDQVANVLEINPMDLLAMEEKFIFQNNTNCGIAAYNHGSFTMNDIKSLEDKIKQLENRLTLQEELLAIYRKNTEA
ncbi:MAG: helix-turn-helix transcriptional regulator [Bacteroidetes bacterium]|nr:helix-turn-helix transcriptional regulator [Bacteroidota bacterium]